MLKDRLKNLRLSKGLTLQQVGDHFGISKSSVANWENGINQPDLRKLEGLADLFKTNVEFLVTGRSNNFVENQDLQANQVRFIKWEDVIDGNFGTHQSTLPTLYSTPSDKAFATRTIGVSSLDWKPGPIPTGSIIFVDPNKPKSHACLVLAIDNSNELGIAEFLISENKDNFILYFFNKNISISSINNLRILGVLLEWRLSGKL